MLLPKGFLDEIRTRVRISDVIGKRVKVTRAGREFKACCPFHKEKTPSFTINDQKGFYHCFGCGAHGDAIRFLTDYENLPFMDAVEQLAALAGVAVPKPTKEQKEKFERQLSLYDVMETATGYYQHQLHAPKNKKILNYLLERGLGAETIKSFRLGYAPGEGDELKQILIKKGFPLDLLVEAGLLRHSTQRKGEVYAFFRDRIIFPVTDFQGRVIAFGGRILPPSHGGPPDKTAPKYINSPETEIFHKGRNLYGLSYARQAIGESKTAIVVEGYMDVIALAQAGFKAAVAPLGTALTESQIEELWKFMPEGEKRPVLCFDGDAAGQNAAARAVDRVLPILKPDHSVAFAFLPERHDPDSLIKEEGRGAMERVLAGAVSLSDMLWLEESKHRNLIQPEDKAGFKDSLIRKAKQIGDADVRDLYIKHINQKFESFFSSKILNKNIAKKQNIKTKIPHNPGDMPYRPISTKLAPPKPQKHLGEQILIAGMVNHPALYEEFSEPFGMLHSDNPRYESLRQCLILLLNEQINLDDQAVKQHLIESGLGETLNEIMRAADVHARFVRTDQPYAVVREGWLEMYERGRTKARLA